MLMIRKYSEGVDFGAVDQCGCINFLRLAVQLMVYAIKNNSAFG